MKLTFEQIAERLDDVRNRMMKTEHKLVMKSLKLEESKLMLKLGLLLSNN